MKRIKLSSAVVIAILAVGIAMTSNAKSIFGKRLITGCYRFITLSDFYGTDSFDPIPNINNCTSVTTTIIINARKYLAAQPSNIVTTCSQTQKFCCIVLEPIPVVNEHLFPNISYFDLDNGFGFRKWRAHEVKCQNN